MFYVKEICTPLTFDAGLLLRFLRDLEGLSHEEIATIMQCALGTAKPRIQRGRCQLRAYLRPFVQPDA